MNKLIGAEVTFAMDQGVLAYQDVSALRFVEADWFDGAFPGGQAWLAEASQGPFTGQHFALSSRWTIPLDEQLRTTGHAAVVLNVVNHPEAGFDPAEHTVSVGFGSARLREV